MSELPDPAGKAAAAPFVRRRRPAWRGPLILTIAALLILTALAAAVYLLTGACAAHALDAVASFSVNFGPAVPGVSPDGRTHYDNLTFHVEPTSLQAACGSAATGFGTAVFGLTLANQTGNWTSPFLPVAAVCSPPENFSACGTPPGEWYAVLFCPSSAPAIQSSFPEYGGSAPRAWTSTVYATEPGEAISIVSVSLVHGTGVQLELYGTGPWAVSGLVVL